MGADSQGLFPEISRLNYSDLNYRQLQEDIEFYHRASGAGKELPPIQFYLYKVETNINIFSIAAQAGLNYETIATFNRISSSESVLTGKTLFNSKPARNFIPENPQTDLEYLELSWRANSIDDADELNVKWAEVLLFQWTAVSQY